MESKSLHIQLRVPTPSRETLSFCEASPRALRDWLAGLPKANLGETARQLYQALTELNQLRVSSELRLQLLELLRPDVHFVCSHLERHYLNQPIVLSERPRKVAGLCQALQNHLAAGYKLVVSRIVSRPQIERPQLLTAALQRALHALGALLVRSTQLYSPASEGLWLELHQLYRLASENGLQHTPVRDALAHEGEALSTEQCYLSTLLFGSARCNQIRQQHIAPLAAALQAWGSLACLRPATHPASLFVFSPQVDGPPRYRSLFAADRLPNMLGLDPSQLVAAIEAHLQLPAEQRQGSRLPGRNALGDDLLRHLAAAWGVVADRSFQRRPGSGRLEACLGMTALHYQLAGERPFNEVLERHDSSSRAVFKLNNGAADVWAKAFDAQTAETEPTLADDHIEFVRPAKPAQATRQEPGSAREPAYPCFAVDLVNQSPGGYCLAWPAEVPAQLQAGELLGLREDANGPWRVATVRWVRQVRGGGTQMGVELIAPNAQPCGVRLLRKLDQGSEYLRALMVPQVSAIARAPTLIVPLLPFQEGHKVSLNQEGEECRAILGSRQAHTGNYNQFEFRVIGDATVARETSITPWSSAQGSAEADFDSLWKSL